jgi:tetratricopeptide (TPR) repeat protein
LGCITIESIKNEHTVNQYLKHSQVLLAQRKYKEALQENQKVLDLSDYAYHKDEAILNIGLIYAHYDNPEKDFKKSQQYFNKLIQQYPQSPLIERAKVWASLLTDIGDLKTKLDECLTSNEYLNRCQEFLGLSNYKEALQENQKVLSSPDENLQKDKALFNIGLIYAHYDNPEKDFKKSRQYFNKLIQQYPQSPLVEHAKIWVGIFNIIEKEKQVDIEIEKKKKELAR